MYRIKRRMKNGWIEEWEVSDDVIEQYRKDWKNQIIDEKHIKGRRCPQNVCKTISTFRL